MKDHRFCNGVWSGAATSAPAKLEALGGEKVVQNACKKASEGIDLQVAVAKQQQQQQQQQQQETESQQQEYEKELESDDADAGTDASTDAGADTDADDRADADAGAQRAKVVHGSRDGDGLQGMRTRGLGIVSGGS